MTISRQEQATFAKTILPLIKKADSLEKLDALYARVISFNKNVGYKDNGISFDLGEYLYEIIQNTKGKEPSGWDKEALRSLKEQLGE